MNLRKAFFSAAAAAALALSLSQPAAAQDAPKPDDSKVRLTTSSRPVFNPKVPAPLAYGLGGAALLLCAYAARQKSRGAWLKAATSGALTLAMLNPELITEERQHLPTEVPVIVDKSASQNLDGRNATTAAMYSEIIKRLSAIEGVNIHTVDVGNTREGAAIDGTRLFGALESMADIPRDRLGAVIMLTDGQVHDIPADAAALGNGAPLHALVSGREGERDRRVVIDDAPSFGLVGKDQKITFRALDEGAPPGADSQIRVTLRSEGKVIASRMVMPGEKTEISVPVTHTGANIVEVNVDPLEGELTDVNNSAVATIAGVRETLNVLLVSGVPNQGLRLWRDLIKSDPDTALVHSTQLRTPENENNVPLNEEALIPFPVNELFNEKLDKFDLIVFDQFANIYNRLPPQYLENVARFVRNGGALLVVSGPDFASAQSLYNSPLASVLPAAPTGDITETSFSPRVTKQGERHPATRDLPAAMPWGRWTRLIDIEKPAGTTLMDGAGGKPLLIFNRVDKGRVAMLQSDSAWLWARGYEGGGPYADLLRNTAHWLMKNPELEEEALRLRAQNGNLIVEQQTMADKSTAVTLRAPSGKTEAVALEPAAPGLWRSTVPAGELGTYAASQGGRYAATAFANVGPANAKEFINTLSTTALLQPLAEKTGGSAARMTSGNGAPIVPRIEARKSGQDMKGDDWIGVRMSDASILKGTSRTPLLPPWLQFLMAGALAGAWWRESNVNPLRKETWTKKTPVPDKSGPAAKV